MGSEKDPSETVRPRNLLNPQLVNDFLYLSL
jgi:hypothetical protein